MPARLAATCLAAAALAALAVAPAQGARLTRASEITFAGVGPVHLNMTVAQARRAAGRRIDVGPEVTRDCRHDRVFPRRLGLATLTFERRIRVLYVSERGLATRRGIRVGDRLSRLRDAYGDALHERRSDVADRTRIFEFRRGNREIHFDVFGGNSVRVIATGARPEVDFSEGCA
jgi:hypothetical protein